MSTPELNGGAGAPAAAANPADTEDFASPEPPYSWPGPARLKVKFRQRAEHAGIDLILGAARKSITIRARDWACPFEAIIRWLEAVAIGVDECACWIEAAGADLAIKFERYWFPPDEGILRVADRGAPERASRFGAKVERAQMVRALYRGFVRFTESPGYDPLAYEARTVGERLAVTMDGKLSGEGLLDAMVHASPREVEELLECGCPLGMWDASESVPRDERWLRLWDSMVERHEGLMGPWPIVYKSRWSGVAATLAGKSTAQRSALIEGWLAEDDGPIRGARLQTLRSPIIERFLAERYPPENDRGAGVVSLAAARLQRAAAKQDEA